MMANPLTTTFGGTCCRPRALRRRLITTTILVKEVTMTATKGASARLTTVTMMSAGLWLPKSIRLESEQLDTQHVADGNQLAVAHARAVGADHDPNLVEVARHFAHITKLQVGKLPKRQHKTAKHKNNGEAEAHQGVRFGCWCGIRL